MEPYEDDGTRTRDDLLDRQAHWPLCYVSLRPGRTSEHLFLEPHVSGLAAELRFELRVRASKTLGLPLTDSAMLLIELE